MIGIYRLAECDLVKTLFDCLCVSVVKMMLAPSLCLYGDASSLPHVAQDPLTKCSTIEQISMAVLGWCGATVWYVWLTTTVRRRSVAAKAIFNLNRFTVVA